MGAGWQRWWNKPRTLEEAYQETEVGSPARRKESRTQLIVMEPIPFGPSVFSDLNSWIMRLYAEQLCALNLDRRKP